jgi:hypothetical protein
MARPRFPQRPLAGDRGSQPVEVREQVRVERFVDHGQAGFVREQLAHGDLPLAFLSELGPVARHALVVVEPAARVGERERHRCEPLRGRVHEHKCVLAPRLVTAGVAHPAPEIHHRVPAHVCRAGRAELVALGEVTLELAANFLEPGCHGAG